MTEPTIEAEAIARAFHEHYEALAPSFRYQTRKATAVPWEDVPEANKHLMRATAQALLDVGVIALGRGLGGLGQPSIEAIDDAVTALLMGIARNNPGLNWDAVSESVEQLNELLRPR